MDSYGVTQLLLGVAAGYILRDWVVSFRDYFLSNDRPKYVVINQNKTSYSETDGQDVPPNSDEDVESEYDGDEVDELFEELTKSGDIAPTPESPQELTVQERLQKAVEIIKEIGEEPNMNSGPKGGYATMSHIKTTTDAFRNYSGASEEDEEKLKSLLSFLVGMDLNSASQLLFGHSMSLYVCSINGANRANCPNYTPRIIGVDVECASDSASVLDGSCVIQKILNIGGSFDYRDISKEALETGNNRISVINSHRDIVDRQFIGNEEKKFRYFVYQTKDISYDNPLLKSLY